MSVAAERLQTIDLRVERLNRTILKLSAPSVVESVLVTLDAGLKGVWLATTMEWTVRVLVMLFLYLRGRWKTMPV